MNIQDYKSYLQSEHWQRLRVQCLDKWKRQCRICLSGRALQCHHYRYRADPYHSTIDDVVVLCDACHGMIHRAGDHKLSPRQLFDKYRKNFLNEPEKKARQIVNVNGLEILMRRLAKLKKNPAQNAEKIAKIEQRIAGKGTALTNPLDILS